MTISRAIYLDYKDSMQEGMPIIYFDGDKEEFIKLCTELGITIIEHEICTDCLKPIRGIMTMNENGKFLCGECENKTPMGITKWIEHGKKYGYIDFYEKNKEKINN